MIKIGAENRKQVILACVVGAVALIQVVRTVWPSGPAAAETSTVAASTSSAAASSSSSSGSISGKASAAKLVATADLSLDPTLRLQLLHAVEGITYGGSGRNIFVEQPDAPPPPPKSLIPLVPVDTGPPPPPPPPPITIKFFGFSSRPGEPKRAFLSQNEDVFIASEGDIVNRRYKVVHINPTSAEIEDVLFNHSQTIPLTQNP